MDNYQPYFDIAKLIAKQMRQELTDQEKTELENWLGSDSNNRELFKKITGEDIINKQPEVISAADKDAAWKNIVAKTGFKEQTKKPVPFRRWAAYAAAVFIPLAIGITIVSLTNTAKKKNTPSLAFHQPDLLPGSNKAILTLANGSKIILDNAGNGNIATQQNAVISKTQNGQVVYNAGRIAEDLTASSTQIIDKVIATNIIATPRGGQYQVVLPDGTKVWLNAASSLKFPIAFTGNERNVELTGEAYFEVAKNAAKPFFVKTSTQTVEVLGTHFNINSYTDEQATKTTLLEGSVKVIGNYGKLMVKLTPGEQAVNNTGGINVVHNADIDEAVAWKNGKFLFTNTNLQTIMRQLSRWYDVDVEYRGTVNEKHYNGRISRNVPVSQIFQILKTSGINFTINGRKIIVKS
jgi:transmembrane sensor